jgi:hypothetical protein
MQYNIDYQIYFKVTICEELKKNNRNVYAWIKSFIYDFQSDVYKEQNSVNIYTSTKRSERRQLIYLSMYRLCFFKPVTIN